MAIGTSVEISWTAHLAPQPSYDNYGMAEGKAKAVALLSGGLDSILAAALTLRLGFEVVGLSIVTGFETDRARQEAVIASGRELGISIRLLEAGDDYLEVIKHPRFGYGSAVNPCLDCRIFMFRKAREFMQEAGAEFVVTGEVLGQRPMTQHYRALRLTAEESGLGDRLVRPLSGRLLPATYPEKRGWVRREDWLDIQGRSRRRQLELARAWRLERYSQPAGGCLLTDKTYAARLRDLFRHRGADALRREDFQLLRLGRHFRISPGVKLVVGRNREENERLAEFARDRIVLEFPNVPGPTALIEGTPTEAELELAARIAARYSDAAPGGSVVVEVTEEADTRTLEVTPLPTDSPKLKEMRIG